MPFDPNQPFQVEGEPQQSSSGFDPTKPFEVADERPAEQPSMLGAAARGAVRGVLPAGAAMAGFGAGATLGLPAGPVGSLVGGLIGAGVGAYGAGKAQEYVLAQLPESARAAIGQSEEKRRADIAAHPYAAEIGEMAPNLALMSPRAATTALGEGATAVQRLMSSPLTARVAGAGLMGAQDVAQQAIQGEPIDWTSAGSSAGAGALMQHPTRLGEALSEVGAAPARRILGRGPVPTAHVAPPSGEAAEAPVPPEVGTKVGVTDPTGAEPPADMTVTRYSSDGKITYLTDQDENVHPMATNDLLPRLTEPSAPAEAAEQPPAPVSEAPAEEPISGLPPAAAEQIVPQAEQQPPAPQPEAPVVEGKPGPPPAAAEPSVSPEVADEQARAALVENAAAAAETAEAPAEELGDKVDQMFEPPEAAPEAPSPAEDAATAAPIVEQIRADQQEIAQTAANTLTAPAATPEGPRVIEGTHTKTGAPIVTVQLPQRVGSDEFKALGTAARQMGGYYSAYRGRGALPGFIFKTREAADQFAALARGEAPAPPVIPPTVPIPEITPPALAATPRDPRDIGHEIARARAEPNGKVDFHGLPFVMENPEGSIRRGVGPDGTPWEVEMPADYGYLARSEGTDGEPVDAYLGPHPESGRAFVIDQVDANTRAYDEHKVMLGFNSWPEARATYERAFSDGRGGERIGNVTPMTLSEIKDWVRDGDMRNPIGQGEFGFERIAPKAPESGTPIEAKAPPFQLADMVTKAVDRGDRTVNAKDLQDMAEKAFGGKLAENAFTRQQMYDGLELGVNQWVAQHPRTIDPTADLKSARVVSKFLEGIKKGLPTQTVRAGEKDRFQQFSTPPDYSYTAAWLGNIRPEDRVLEPSAGNGSLVAMAKNANPREVVANELFLPRAENLDALGTDRTFRENAEQLHNILPADVKPSLVLMNPPFSATAGRMGDRTVLMTGARHMDQALARLEPSGRLVAIVGRGMTMEAPTFRNWWANTLRNYDVRANVGIPGSVYQKYGTNFGTRLLVIDKVPPSGRPVVTGDMASLPEAMEALDAVRADRPGIAGEQVAAQPAGVEVAQPGQPAVELQPTVPSPTPVGGVRGEPSDTRPGGQLPGGSAASVGPTPGLQPGPRPSDALVHGEPERPGPGGTERYSEAAPGAVEDVGGGSAAPDGVVLRPEDGAGSVLPASGEPPSVEPSGEPAGPPPETIRVDQLAADPTPGAGVTEAVYEPYKPQRISIEGAQPHPGDLVQSAAMASVVPPMVDYAPRIPKNLIATGALSDAQLEAITYAGYSHSQILPTNVGETPYRRGYFIGDGTGVGKGREVAGIILDNFQQGRQKALWISEKRTLINDASRDWTGLGGQKSDLLDIGKVKAGGDMKTARGIGFMTYDTLKGAERVGKDAEGKTIKGQSRLDQIVKWLGPNFDGVIAFDEAHNMANATKTQGDRGAKDASQKALAGIELQKKLPNARVVYVSATGATEVSNLAYAERLGLWGRGTAFPNVQAFIQNIGSGGIAAMELVARDMKTIGSYLSRNLSYDDVKYDRIEHQLSPDDKSIYDGLAEAWQHVLRNINVALQLTGAPDHQGVVRPDKTQKKNAMGAFWGSHQRFFNQIITSMQMPTVIRGVENDLKEGRQAVLQLVNTNEASQKRAIEKRRAAEGEGEDIYEDLDLTPRDQLAQMVDKSFPTQQTETYVDDNGNERTRPVVDSKGNAIHNPQAVRLKEALLEKIGSLKVPDGPLERLLNYFGPDKVAEVTGRKERVVHIPDKNGVIRATPETRGVNTNPAEASAFQNAKKPILVFSEAGGTGASYHADNTAPSAGAQRSHYLVQAGWRADKAIQGFGRTHRTNQASAPIFHLVTTDLQGQKRFISSIARRLSQLGALTKGERRAGDQGLFSAKDNLESPEAHAALRDFWRSLQVGKVEGVDPRDFTQQTGLSLVDSKGGNTEPPEIPQFLNRLLSLKYDMQNHVFGEFDRRLSDAVDKAAAAGTLDTGTETLKGDRISKAEEKTVYTDPQSGAETKYVKLKVDTKNKPATFDQVSSGKRLTAGRQPVFYAVSKRSGKIYAVSEASSSTDASGRVVDNYRLSDPLQWNYTQRSRMEDDRYWERIDDEKQARQLWEQQLKSIPEYNSEDVHLITGAVLPIWDRLHGMPKVYRLQTSEGEGMLGRVIDNKSIDQTLQALGTETEGKTYVPQEVADRVMRGDRATLANGWTLKRSIVAGEPRIEVVGPNYTHRDELAHDGVYTERIAYDTRFFVPTGDQAGPTLERMLERRPVTDMASARSADLAEEAPRGWAAQHSITDLNITNPNPAERSTARAENIVSASGVAQQPSPLLRGAVYENLLENFPQRPDAPHRAARNWTLERGSATGNEHLAAFDPAVGETTHAYTLGLPRAIGFLPELDERLLDPTANMVIHHNHPGGDSLSGQDVKQLSLPGLDSILAHAGNDTFSARLTPEMKMRAISDPDGTGTEIGTSYERAEARVTFRLNRLVDSGALSIEQADHLYHDLVNRAMDAAGLTDYTSSRVLGSLSQGQARNIVRDAAGNIRQDFLTDKDFNARVNRSTLTVRPDESLARLPGADETSAVAGSGRSAGVGEGRERVSPENQAGARGLAEEAGGTPPPTGPPGTEPPSRGEPPDRPSAFGILKKGFNALTRDVQMKLTPMAVGAPEAQAIAKDFANAERAARAQRQSFDNSLTKFSRADRQRLWETADAASVAAQQHGPAAGQKILDTLAPHEQAILAEIDKYSKDLWQRATDAGVVSGDALPFYTTRAIVNMGEDGHATRVGGIGGGSTELDKLGVNLRTKGTDRRRYMEAAETEAAAKARFGEQAQLVRDIRVVPMALERLERSVAGREMINDIKTIGKTLGQDTVSDGAKSGFFTIDHPAFKTYRPRFTDLAGKTVPLRDPSGNIVFDKVPIYVARDFEGPLRAVLRHEDGALYRGAMQVKAGAVSLIMNSPLIHNEVVWGRALPAMPGKVATFKAYFEGNKFRTQDRAGMDEAIRQGGYVPFGTRGYMQDITGIAEDPSLRAGRSITAKIMGSVGDLYSPELGAKIRSAVDKAGDFWHGFLLWDRVEDLHAGLYVNFRDKMLSEGKPRLMAVVDAAHLANRYVGAIPGEAMSEMAKKVANVGLFSRSYKLGNIGIMKDVFTGLPRDQQAILARDLGEVGRAQAVSYARAKAIRTVAIDVALYYALNAVFQTGLDMILRDKSGSDVEKEYDGLLSGAFDRIKEHPLEVLNPLGFLSSISPTSENEPGKQNRIFWMKTSDGTNLYLRSPVSKFAEEMVGWQQQPLQMIKNAEGTLARPITNTLMNDKGFGQKVYDSDYQGIGGVASNIGRIMWEFMRSQVPENQFAGLAKIAQGEAREGDVAQTVAPFAGFTVSRGAPGGPGVGIKFDADRQYRQRVQDIMPKVNDLIRGGKIDEAIQQMEASGMTKSDIAYRLKTAQVPASRLSPAAMRKFEKEATPDQRAAMQRALAAQGPSQQP